MLCRGNSIKCRKEGSVPVYLNVYDLTSMNGYAYWLGLGILIGWTEKNLREVRGIMEDLAEDYKGISYNLITKNCNHFCNDVCVRLTGNSIPSWINRLARIGKQTSKLKITYRRNNWLRSEFLSGDNPGFLCNCIIPASISSIKVGIEDDKVHNEGEMKRLRSRSSRFTSSSSCSPASENSPSTSPTAARTTGHRTTTCLPPPSPLILDSPKS
ncbi:hypothetical protein LXL04_023975 [Taraxacum kok-saghyz]